MSTFKVRAMVIKETAVGEADKIITLLCKDKGKINVSARGAKKPKSKFLAGAQLFAWSDFVLYEGRGFYSAAQIDLIESFYALRQDFERLKSASYCLEILDKAILPEENCNGVLKLLLKTFQHLSRGAVPPELAARIFELKFLDCEGYRPQTEACTLCGKDLAEEPKFFCMEGLLCGNCKTKTALYSQRISDASLYTIDYILSSDLERLFNFTVSDAVIAELRKISKIYMSAVQNGIITDVKAFKSLTD